MLVQEWLLSASESVEPVCKMQGWHQRNACALVTTGVACRHSINKVIMHVYCIMCTASCVLHAMLLVDLASSEVTRHAVVQQLNLQQLHVVL